MKTYIIPTTDIEPTTMLASVMAGSTHNEEGDGEDAINRGFHDKMEDFYPPKDNGLWDDAYRDNEE